jgi:hypothetical protein
VRVFGHYRGMNFPLPDGVPMEELSPVFIYN